MTARQDRLTASGHAQTSASGAYLALTIVAVLSWATVFLAASISELHPLATVVGSSSVLALVVVASYRLAVNAPPGRRLHLTWLLVGVAVALAFVLPTLPASPPLDYRG